jgi:uncharacterized membrane protein
MEEEPTSEPRENRDPITGKRGAHPLGTGLGTTGGAVAGAAIGAAIGGPVGGVAGTVVGGVIGAYVGWREIQVPSDHRMIGGQFGGNPIFHD